MALEQKLGENYKLLAADNRKLTNNDMNATDRQIDSQTDSADRYDQRWHSTDWWISSSSLAI